MGVLSRESKKAYWGVVEECLRAFHGFDRSTAEAMTGEYRADVEADGDPIAYHASPFDVACDLAARPLDVDAHWVPYAEIRERHYHPHGQLAAAR